MNKYYLRINGRGNAWPIPLGQEHPFYSGGNDIDYANASFSLMEFKDDEKTRENLVWEGMIDAGHGAIPFLLRNFNRIPDALFITHPHFDHILGIDWIAQSYYRFNDKQKYPLYSTENCWKAILKTIPHLEQIISFHPLELGVKTGICGQNNIFVTAFPVYHGASVNGSAMLLFEIKRNKEKVSKILFTGDVLLPLLNEKAYRKLHDVDYLVVDANNRFPYPRANHWSISKTEDQKTNYLEDFVRELNLTIVRKPHTDSSAKVKMPGYFKDFEDKLDWKAGQCFTVFDLVQQIHPKRTIPVHYSGLEDKKYYKRKILNSTELQEWLNKLADKLGLSTTFTVAENGDYFRL